MSEVALYRKYRPQNWDEVIGQAPVVATLKQAIASGRTSHAYLFTGPRGGGKTSVARILARSLNCTGPTKPCGKCANCRAALAGNLDIIEIDAASNRGIDEIRDLRDKLNLAPSLGQYKIYIIDEVHMLTEAAFNALLKTLEEPPGHAVFVLATTEAHKLPATIVSRTQRFSFRPIATSEITRQLSRVAKQEQLQAEPAALDLVAQAASGSLRDALSLLDQLSALSSKITPESTQELLGWGNPAEVQTLAQSMLAGRAESALKQWQDLSARGSQASQLITQLLGVVRQELRQAITQPAQAQVAAQLLENLMAATKSALPEYAIEVVLARLPNAVVAPAASVPAKPTMPSTPPAAPAPVSTPAAKAPPSDDFNDRWLKTLALVKAQNNSLYALICSCATHPNSQGIELVARFSFHRDRLLEAKNLDLIAASATKAFGRAMPISVSLQAVSSPALKNLDPATELVSSALEILGGEVVE